jgi:CDP-paratose 2-epimerase
MSAMSFSAPVLITGGAGFIGSNLADRFASEGRRVIVYDSLDRAGVADNLAWLRARWGEQIIPVIADVRDGGELARAAAEASAVVHLAAQVAVTTSLVDPVLDFEVNLYSTVRLLEALRQGGTPKPLVFASTNKVYGDLADVEVATRGMRCEPADPQLAARGVGEDRSLAFHTPYGCSKGAADQYVLDYARCFRLPACVLRMSCIYGRRQMGCEDQGWVAHFAIRALERAPITLYGDGRQVRDILDVRDAAAAYARALKRMDRLAGRALNLGGGPENAVSLLEVIELIQALTGERIALDFDEPRTGDQRWYVSDPRRARAELELAPFRSWREGVADLVQWLAETRERAAVRAAWTATAGAA